MPDPADIQERPEALKSARRRSGRPLSDRDTELLAVAVARGIDASQRIARVSRQPSLGLLVVLLLIWLAFLVWALSSRPPMAVAVSPGEPLLPLDVSVQDARAHGQLTMSALEAVRIRLVSVPSLLVRIPISISGCNQLATQLRGHCSEGAIILPATFDLELNWSGRAVAATEVSGLERMELHETRPASPSTAREVSMTIQCPCRPELQFLPSQANRTLTFIDGLSTLAPIDVPAGEPAESVTLQVRGDAGNDTTTWLVAFEDVSQLDLTATGERLLLGGVASTIQFETGLTRTLPPGWSLGVTPDAEPAHVEIVLGGGADTVTVQDGRVFRARSLAIADAEVLSPEIERHPWVLALLVAALTGLLLPGLRELPTDALTRRLSSLRGSNRARR